ncbi:MAG: SWIM zinc finger family protein [Bacilli bacterium]|jgi:hypothetical protein|nr:SWIM zinc finger domain-containing protein [Bacilli bacterium]
MSWQRKTYMNKEVIVYYQSRVQNIDMGILESASSASFWRGFYYYRNHAVKQFAKVADRVYAGTVSGGSDYHVVIDLDHVRNSTCDCPHASGKRIVCKHKVALYFAVFPKEAKKAEKSLQEAKKREEERMANYDKAYEKIRQEVKEYVDSMPIEDLKERLISMIADEQMEQYRDTENDDEDTYY